MALHGITKGLPAAAAAALAATVFAVIPMDAIERCCLYNNKKNWRSDAACG
jgi:hypothetical protein